MEKEISEKELFETIPVPRAVATLAIPTIISQVVTMIYNLADTFFVGQIGNPYMVAAVSLVSPWFNLLTALGNLFGLGGGSLISRMLGKQNHKDIKNVSAFSVWGGDCDCYFESRFRGILRGHLYAARGTDQWDCVRDLCRGWDIITHPNSLPVTVCGTMCIPALKPCTPREPIISLRISTSILRQENHRWFRAVSWKLHIPHSYLYINRESISRKGRLERSGRPDVQRGGKLKVIY